MVPPREKLVLVDAGWGGNDGPWPWEDWDYDSHPSAMGDSGLLHDWGYSCGLRVDGSLLCWGNGGYFWESYIYSSPEGVFVDVGVGKHQACALRQNHKVECWGLYGNYVYGEGEGEDGVRFNSLEVGGWFACGRLSPGGHLRCWDLRNQAPVLSTWVDSKGVGRGYSVISAGYFHVCGYRKGIGHRMRFNAPGADCWGPPITRDLKSP